MYTMTKTFHDFPCCHRQPKDDGHCRFLHGYSRSFTFVFSAHELDERGWVWGFNHLKGLKEHLAYMFDHTTLINEDDPFVEAFKEMHQLELIDLRVMSSVGMEGTAKYLYDWVQTALANSPDSKQRGVACISVEARENGKNAATYYGHD